MKYTRELLRDVEGYVPGEQPRDPHVIKLNTNENPYPPSPRVLDAIQTISEDALRKYPDPVALKLRMLCAERYNLPGPEWVVAGNGMDEVLALTVRTFVDPGDTILSVSPTYTLYETLAQLHGAKFASVELDEDFLLPPAFFDAKARLCMLPRPNAPSGVTAPIEEVARFCESFDGLVLIDEAYADFADDHCMDFPLRYDNVIVARTFSKSFSLAGVRLGLAAANPDIIAEFLKTKDSYNVNVLTQAAGVAAMEDYDYMAGNVVKICITRERLIRGLRELGFEVPESQANFVLAQWNGHPHTREVFEGLRTDNILVRYFDTPRLEDALRITVGTDDEIDALLTALHGIIGR